MDLAADQAEDQLMVGFDKAGGVDQVGGVDGVEESVTVILAISSLPGSGVRWNSGTLPPCTMTVLTPGEPVEPRLQIVGGDLP